MDEATRKRVLAAKEAREAKQKEAVAAVKKLRSAPLKETLKPTPEPVDVGHADTANDFSLAGQPRNPPPPRRTLAEQVNDFLDEYIEAIKEIEGAEKRLIELRGGEENLTEDDREALLNVADLIKARYERMLDI